ncbi:integrase arm-type DNA-binding domain-containing protein [Mesorhizobium sp. CAU 1741]|uniref:tyrosine-type recombinase/integrase n=1 Tax=Mesorhizobium sp. CAU 1741 TaxID=3140366 RepID=UPI00325AF270
MARGSKKLSATEVKAIVRPGRHADGGGLYLNVSASGTKSWVYLFMKNRVRREMGLGAYPAVSLAAAREKAESARAVVAAGEDPFALRRQEAPKTFAEAAEAFIGSMEKGWRNDKHVAQWRMTLGPTYCKDIQNRPVSEVSTDDVLAVLSPIWTTKVETASRVRGRIERVLEYAKVKGWRTGDNPALWRGHLRGALPPRKKLQRGHHAAMPYSDVPQFVGRLTSADAMAARALEFLILTAARSGEVINARWSEIKLKEGVWIVPKERMKAGVEHRVPLPERAIAILTALHDTRLNEFVFPGEKKDRPLSPMALTMLMRRMDAGHFTPHGFRSSFRDWAGDATSFPREIAEAALAHKVGDETERAYRRSDALARRRKMMGAWAAFCTRKNVGKKSPQ